MKQVIREHLIDCSDQEKFVFNLICPECGKVWQSTPVGFSKAEEDPRTESKQVVFYLLYEREKKRAFDKAVEEAGHFFNLCPLCERLVCNNCFLICKEIDVCRRVQSGCRKQENRFRLWTGAPHEDHCGEKIG